MDVRHVESNPKGVVRVRLAATAEVPTEQALRRAHDEARRAARGTLEFLYAVPAPALEGQWCRDYLFGGPWPKALEMAH